MSAERVAHQSSIATPRPIQVQWLLFFLKRGTQLLATLILSFLILLVSPLYGDQASSIKGRIVSEQANAEVVWLGVFVGPMEPEAEAWSWTSVATKEFSLGIPDTKEEITLIALQKNSVPITIRITPELLASEITLTFESGQVFSGTVLSTDEIAIPDAVLTVERRDEPSPRIPSEAQFEWTTEADGTFSIGGLVGGRYDVQVALKYVPKESFNFRVQDGEDVRRDLLLADAYHVKGRVVDHVGAVVVGANLSASLWPAVWKDESGNVRLSTELEGVRELSIVALPRNIASDTLGAFQLGPFVEGQRLELSASHVDGGSTNSIDVFSGNHEIILILSKMVDVFGTVVDAATGVPIEQFTLEVRGGANNEIPHSDSGGRISAQVDSAALAVAIQAPEYIPYLQSDLELDSLDVYDMGIVELDPGKLVTGQVFDLKSGQPIEKALIESWVNRQEDELPSSMQTSISRYKSGVGTRSDSEGKFSVGPVPSDESVLAVEAYGYKTEEIVVDPQVTILDIGLTARDARNTKIVARIQTKNGESVSGTVGIYHVEGSRTVPGFPRNDGSFEYRVYPGTYKVWATSNRGRSKTLDVIVKEGNTEEIVLVVDPLGRLRGTVSGLHRAEYPFVSILSGSNVVQAGRVSNGEFEIEGIGIGSFTVRVWTSINRQLEQSFELSKDVDEAFVELAFEGDSRLYGKVLSFVNKDRNPQVRAIGKEKGSISGWGDVLDDGSFEIRGLSDGEYWIEISAKSEPGIGSTNEESEPLRYEAVVVGDTELTLDLASP